MCQSSLFEKLRDKNYFERYAFLPTKTAKNVSSSSMLSTP
jgi:hypothetical protein